MAMRRTLGHWSALWPRSSSRRPSRPIATQQEQYSLVQYTEMSQRQRTATARETETASETQTGT
eukprot:1377625-Rhodomonas_salina.1